MTNAITARPDTFPRYQRQQWDGFVNVFSHFENAGAIKVNSPGSRMIILRVIRDYALTVFSRHGSNRVTAPAPTPFIWLRD